MNNEPVAWIKQNPETLEAELHFDKPTKYWATVISNPDIPLYTHPVKEQLSNGHLSDCAIHNEPALRNKPCDCGFEPKFNLSDLKHEDNCRYFDDGSFCTCGAEDSALVEWYRHKEVTHPVKELNEAIKIIKDFQSDDVPPCKSYEDTYADGWMDACNEILWAIEEKVQET